MGRTRHWHSHRDFDAEDRDYEDAAYFIPAGTGHFRRPRTARTIRHIVIHITGGHATDESGAVNRFRSAGGGASAHYIINREGEVIQMVREENVANHLRGGLNGPLNTQSIGIEHVNTYTSDLRQSPTEPQYNASARLVAFLCDRYNIPVIHSTNSAEAGIIGHSEIDTRTEHRNCPNPAWNWEAYIPKVLHHLLASHLREAMSHLSPFFSFGRFID